MAGGAVRARLAAHGWRLLTRVGLWCVRKQIKAIGGHIVHGFDGLCISANREQWRKHGHEIKRLQDSLRELTLAHADHCERLQHLRAGR
jgi:hypothetical protein